jgi:hypothetical protein
MGKIRKSSGACARGSGLGSSRRAFGQVSLPNQRRRLVVASVLFFKGEDFKIVYQPIE